LIINPFCSNYEQITNSTDAEINSKLDESIKRKDSVSKNLIPSKKIMGKYSRESESARSTTSLDVKRVRISNLSNVSRITKPADTTLDVKDKTTNKSTKNTLTNNVNANNVTNVINSNNVQKSNIKNITVESTNVLEKSV